MTNNVQQLMFIKIFCNDANRCIQLVFISSHFIRTNEETNKEVVYFS